MLLGAALAALTLLPSYGVLGSPRERKRPESRATGASSAEARGSSAGPSWASRLHSRSLCLASPACMERRLAGVALGVGIGLIKPPVPVGCTGLRHACGCGSAHGQGVEKPSATKSTRTVTRRPDTKKLQENVAESMAILSPAENAEDSAELRRLFLHRQAGLGFLGLRVLTYYPPVFTLFDPETPDSSGKSFLCLTWSAVA